MRGQNPHWHQEVFGSRAAAVVAGLLDAEDTASLWQQDMVRSYT